MGSVHFCIVLWYGLYFSRSIGPSYVVSTNNRVLIYCTCHFQGSSLCFSFFCLLVCSVSNLHPGRKGRWWTLFKAHLSSRAVGREEHCKQISLAYLGSAHSVWTTLGLPSLTCVLSQSILLRFQVALQGNCLKLALGCMHFPGLSHSGSGSWVLHKGTDSFEPAFCALPRSEHLRQPSA